MNSDFSIRALIRPDRGKLAITYAITLAERLCTVAYPALTGVAIDGLLARRWSGLAVLVGIWMLHLLLSFIRQRFDTRVFTRIYARVATAVVLRQRDAGLDISEVSARAELSREFVDFFEVEIPAITHNLVAVIGSLAFLFTYDLQAGLIAAAVLVPVTIVNVRYASHSARLNRGLNNQIEREVRTLSSGGPFAVNRHFRLLSRWKIALSDAQSVAWAATELARIVGLAIILLDFTLGGSNTVTAGAVYAIIAYIYSYLGGLNDIPNVVNNLTRLRDIKNRLR